MHIGFVVNECVLLFNKIALHSEILQLNIWSKELKTKEHNVSKISLSDI
jgi:hypothetical protein